MRSTAEPNVAQLGLDYDVCSRKHGGNRESRDAHERIRPAKLRMRMLVLGVVQRCGEGGATAKEVADVLGRPLHTISGRCRELKDLHLVRVNGMRRDGGAVLVAVTV